MNLDILDLVSVESANSIHLKLKWKDESHSCPPEDYFVTINGNRMRGKRLIAGNWTSAALSATLLNSASQMLESSKRNMPNSNRKSNFCLLQLQ
jgi:hypothetical protein